MAIAYLSQSMVWSRTGPGQEFDESWECRNPQETDLGMKLVFSENSARLGPADRTFNQDILLINGSSQFLMSKLIVVIVFAIMIMNS